MTVHSSLHALRMTDRGLCQKGSNRYACTPCQQYSEPLITFSYRIHITLSHSVKWNHRCLRRANSTSHHNFFSSIKHLYGKYLIYRRILFGLNKNLQNSTNKYPTQDEGNNFRISQTSSFVRFSRARAGDEPVKGIYCHCPHCAVSLTA